MAVQLNVTVAELDSKTSAYYASVSAMCRTSTTTKSLRQSLESNANDFFIYLQRVGILEAGDPTVRAFKRANAFRQVNQMDTFADVKTWMNHVIREHIRANKKMEYERMVEAGPWC